MEKVKLRPWGIFGGEAGQPSEILVAREGQAFKKFTEAFGVACEGEVLRRVSQAR